MNNQEAKKTGAPGFIGRLLKSNGTGIFLILLAMCLALTVAVGNNNFIFVG